MSAREAIARALGRLPPEVCKHLVDGCGVNWPEPADACANNRCVGQGQYAPARIADIITAALKQAGYRIVPEEPTEAMVYAGAVYAEDSYDSASLNAVKCYRAMLAEHEDSE